MLAIAGGFLAANNAHAQTPQPILEIDGYTLEQYRVSASGAQDIEPFSAQRGVGLDGSLRNPAPFGWVVNANPFAHEWNEQAWYHDVMLHTGRYSPTKIDMMLPAPGFSWTVGRTYSIPESGVPSEGYQGFNWQQISQPEILVHDPTGTADDRIYLVYGADRFVEFAAVAGAPGVYRGVNGASGAVVEASSGSHDLLVYWDQHGTRSTFFDPRDPDSELTGLSNQDGRGQLWTIEDAAGNTAYVGHETDPALAIENGYDDARRMQVAYDTAGRRYDYTYTSVTGSQRLTSVEAFVFNGTTWDPVGCRVEYIYYTSTITQRGRAGDLREVHVVRPLSDFDPLNPTQNVVTEKSLYHYETDSTRRSFIRAYVGPEAYRRYVNEVALSILNATTSGLGEYWTARFSSYTSGTSSYPYRVRRYGLPGIGQSSTLSSKFTQFEYEDYETFSNTPGAYDPEHAFVVNVWSPGESLATDAYEYLQYFDEAGQPLSQCVNPRSDDTTTVTFPDTSFSQASQWLYVRRDAAAITGGVDGMINLQATPLSIASAVQNPAAGGGYIEPCTIKSGLGSGTHAGKLVSVFPRVSSASDPMRGFLQSRSWQHGGDPDPANRPEDGPHPVHSFTYLAHGLNSAAAVDVGGFLVLRPYIASETRYPNIDLGSGIGGTELATFSYEFHAEAVGGGGSPSASDPQWLRHRLMKVEHPLVSFAQLGSGVIESATHTLRADGTPAFHIDEVGTATYWQHDNDLVVKQIEDADLSSSTAFAMGDEPTNFFSPVPATIGAMELVTTTIRDEIGRPTSDVLTTGRGRTFFHTALSSGEHVMVLSKRTDGSTHYGPALMEVRDHAGNVIVDADIAFTPSGSTSSPMDSWIDATASHPLESLSVGTYVRIDATIFNESGVVVYAERSYHTAPTTGWGVRQDHYDETLYAYLNEYRVRAETNQAGSIKRYSTFDPFGMPTATVVGHFDPGDPTQNPADGTIRFFDQTAGSTTLAGRPACCDPIYGWAGFIIAYRCDSNEQSNTQTSQAATPFDVGGTRRAGQSWVQGDIKGRAVFDFNPDAPHVFREYDNLGRLVAVATYSAVPDQGPDSFGLDVTNQAVPGIFDHDDPDIFKTFDSRFQTPRTVTQNRTSLLVYEYTPRGQLFSVKWYNIHQTGLMAGQVVTSGSPAADEYIESVTAYDAAGRAVFTDNGRKTKVALDRLGRPVSKAVLSSSDDVDYDDLFDLVGDIVQQEVNLVTRPETGQMVASVHVDHVPRASGDPIPIGSLDQNVYGPVQSWDVTAIDLLGRAQITTFEYDLLDRVTTRNLYGTAGTDQGTSFNPLSPPAEVRTTLLGYDPAGRVGTITDALGRIQERGYDLAGRFILRVDNASATAADDTNRRTRWIYENGQLKTYQATYDTPGVPGSNDIIQNTTYKYVEAPILDRTNWTRDLLRRIEYIDGTSEEFFYNQQGVLTANRDRAGNFVRIETDDLFRPKLVTTFASSGFDSSPEDIQIEYDNRGNIISLTQANGINTLDVAEYEYDGWGNIVAFRQEHPWLDDLVNGTSQVVQQQSVEYEWEFGDQDARRTLRLASMDLPGTGGLTEFAYLGMDGDFNRVSSVKLDGATVASYRYLGIDRVASTSYPLGTGGTAYPVYSSLYNGGFAFDALDRYNRVSRSRWNRERSVDPSNEAPFYDTEVRWDERSNILGFDDHYFADDFDYDFEYDGFDRLQDAQRGEWDSSTSTISTLAERESWELSKLGTWISHDLDLNGDGDFIDNPPSEFESQMTYSFVNERELVERDTDGDGIFTPPLEVIDRVYNDGAQLIEDPAKDHVYTWDVLGRLVSVESSSGDPIAEYRYNALGYRIAEHTDVDGDGILESTDDDPWVRFIYDAEWRVVATFEVKQVADTETLTEWHVHHNAGLDGMGSGSLQDDMVLRRRDSDSNGQLTAADETHFYCQNFRGDVVAIVDQRGVMVEHIRYSSYGVPYVYPFTDVNRDGMVNFFDISQVPAAIADYNNGGPYRVEYDFNLDGTLNFFDQTEYQAQFGIVSGSADLGRGHLSAFGHRRGFGGYSYNASLSLYDVRYRWYDPSGGIWLSPDPWGYVDGPTLYEYVGSMPWSQLDPYGLSYWRDFGEGAEHVWDTLFGDPNEEEIEWANMISRIASKQAKYARDRGFRCLALKILNNSFGDINAVLDQAQDAADTTVQLLEDVKDTLVDTINPMSIPGIGGGATKLLTKVPPIKPRLIPAISPAQGPFRVTPPSSTNMLDMFQNVRNQFRTNRNFRDKAHKWKKQDGTGNKDGKKNSDMSDEDLLDYWYDYKDGRH